MWSVAGGKRARTLDVVSMSARNDISDALSRSPFAIPTANCPARESAAKNIQNRGQCGVGGLDRVKRTLWY